MKDIQYYKELNYKMILEFDPVDEVYFVKFPDLPGCIAHGSTPREAVDVALEVKGEWLETAIETGWAIPEPSLPLETSGRVTLRIPKSIHQKIIDRAEQEGVSQNQLILTYVAEGLERASSINYFERGINQISQELTSLNKERKQSQPDWMNPHDMGIVVWPPTIQGGSVPGKESVPVNDNVLYMNQYKGQQRLSE